MRSIRFLAPALALLAAASAGCSSKGSTSTSHLPTTLCTPETKACLGNYAAVCAADGRSFINLRACYPDGDCQNGACTPRKCTPAGKDRCDGIDVALLCSANGLMQTKLPCPTFQSCYAGACLLDACDAAKDKATCTFDTRVLCVDGKRTAEACPTGTACDGDTCVARQDCTPEEARCSGDAASGICRLNATGWDVTDCKSTEHCVDGFCQLRLGDLPPPADVIDEGISDVEEVIDIDPGKDYGPQPDVYVVPPNRVSLDGNMIAFDLLPTVSLIPANEQTQAVSQIVLLLQSSKKTDLLLPGLVDGTASPQMEIGILGVPVVPPFTSSLIGTYSCGATDGLSARIWLRYGLHSSATSGACTNFDFGAGSCTVTVTDIGPDGLGPLKGTFEALGMVECLGGSSARSISARDGVFEADLDL